MSLRKFQIDLPVPLTELQEEILPWFTPRPQGSGMGLDDRVWPCEHQVVYGSPSNARAGVLPRCEAFAALMPGFTVQITLAGLGTGSIIPTHTDTNFPANPNDPQHAPRVRIHVPIVTGWRCHFFVWDFDRTIHEIGQPAGTVWALHTDLQHVVANASWDDRIHLIIDKAYNREMADWLDEVCGGWDSTLYLPKEKEVNEQNWRL
jgi:hypothetical protein